MIELKTGIRNTVRALIFREQQLLLLVKDGDGRGLRYALPGGAQESGESLEQALERECEEEIAASVRVGKLVHVTDYLKTVRDQPSVQRHLVEFLFLCEIDANYRPRNGSHPDKHQTSVIWAELNSLVDRPIYPHYLSSVISASEAQPTYLGTFDDQKST